MGLTQAFPVLHSTAAIVPCISLRFTKFRSVLLNEPLKKAI